MSRFFFFYKTAFFFFISSLIGCTEEPIATAKIDQSLKQQIALKILAKTNVIRSENGLSPLTQNDDMDELAELHSQNMITFSFFDHVDHEDKSPSDRADDLRFSWSSIAENIGYVPWAENVIGCGDARMADLISSCVVDGWEKSPGHFANIIGNYKELGVGVAFTQDSIAYFTQVFRTP